MALYLLYGTVGITRRFKVTELLVCIKNGGHQLVAFFCISDGLIFINLQYVIKEPSK